MTRIGDVKEETRTEKLIRSGGLALHGALRRAVATSGGELTGINLRYNGLEWLATIKAEVSGRPSVAFVGSGTLLQVVVKITREGDLQKLRWREDKWAQ
jgi:hypothetical protein